MIDLFRPGRSYLGQRGRGRVEYVFRAGAARERLLACRGLPPALPGEGRAERREGVRGAREVLWLDKVGGGELKSDLGGSCGVEEEHVE